MPHARLQIIDGHARDSIPALRTLFLEYSAWLNVDLRFQGFEAELAALPGRYAPPAGAVLLALVDGALAGCVALRPLEPAIGEIKRLWVREAFRGAGAGRCLIDGIVERSRAAGYRRLRLDTLSHMHAALRLYRDAGFHEVAPYYDNPLPGAVYLEKTL